MENYIITGMSCAACVARVERAVSKVDGVQTCSVNLLTNSMSVDGSAKSDEIIKAVEGAGYGARLKGAEKRAEVVDELEDRETPKLKKRLFWSLGFLIVIMYISMGHMMWSFPMIPALQGDYVSLAIIQMLLAGIILVINQKFFVNGMKGLIKLSPNMDTLVALGSGASYIYSAVATIVMSNAQLNGNTELTHSLAHQLYFESSAMILTLITVGKMLEAYSKGKTTSALKGLMSLQPKTAIALIDGKEQEIKCEEIKKGDIIIVKTGGSVPIDAKILEGSGSIDESTLTGESLPVDKTIGEMVYAGTINKSGYIKCEAIGVGEETALSQIIRAVTESASSKAPIARIADKVSGVFVPIVMGIALITIICWLFAGESVGFSLARGISVLVISCPCALGLATPVAIMVGNGVGAKNGILFKNATSLENLGRGQIVVLDKTGTITKGEPSVTDIIPLGIDKSELLKITYSVEIKSEHPLAHAIVKKCEEINIIPEDVSDFQALTGSGVSGKIKGSEILIGSYKFIFDKGSVDKTAKDKYEELSQQGKTPLFVKKDGELVGIIGIRDEIKEDSAEAINRLKEMGIRVVMLTGDNEKSARAIADLVKIDRVIANVMPRDKESTIKALKNEGKVIMVGDGVNDAPALAVADTGIAIGQGTEIAIDTAEVVLMNGSLVGVANAIKLSRHTLNNIRQNLFWAFIYNGIGIPVATGALIPLLGWGLTPMLGALAMSLSSFCVITNALRLNLIKFNKSKKEKAKKMKEVIKVEGMMCPHCEARVKKVLEEIEGVKEAIPSHKKKNVTLTLDDSASIDTLLDTIKEAITAQGYTVK